MATDPVCRMMASSVGGKTYTCPKHPEVARIEPSRCPKYGMTLVPNKT